MKREEIMRAFEILALSQGSYGRLLNAITEDEEAGNEFLNLLESQNFADTVDLVMFIEG